MLLRRDQRIPVLRRIHGQEDDGIFVFVDNVMIRKGRVPRQDSANKARPGPDPSHIGVQVGLVAFEHYLLGANLVRGDMRIMIYRNTGRFKLSGQALIRC